MCSRRGAPGRIVGAALNNKGFGTIVPPPLSRGPSGSGAVFELALLEGLQRGEELKRLVQRGIAGPGEEGEWRGGGGSSAGLVPG